jgi:hypothetical protein
VVVLGCRNANTSRAHALNRWRVRAVLRSIDPGASGTRVIFCGGSVANGGASEASLMARYAVEERGYDGSMVVEDQSHSTWENVANIVLLVEGFDRIKFVSNSLHAEKARLYLQRQRPDLARRLVRASEYRVGEWAVLKPLFAMYGLWTLRRAETHTWRPPRTELGRARRMYGERSTRGNSPTTT